MRDELSEMGPGFLETVLYLTDLKSLMTLFPVVKRAVTVQDLRW